MVCFISFHESISIENIFPFIDINGKFFSIVFSTVLHSVKKKLFYNLKVKKEVFSYFEEKFQKCIVKNYGIAKNKKT